MEDQEIVESEVRVESLAEVEPEAPKRRGRPPKAKEDDATKVKPATSILLHVVEDGFTASGAVWVRGQELEYEIGSVAYKDTLDRTGKSWLDLVGDEPAQMQKFGRVMVRPGPWPGDRFEDEAAAQAEEKRGRKPPKLSTKV